MEQKYGVALILIVSCMMIPFPLHSKEDFLIKAQKSMDLMDYDQAIYYYEKVLIQSPSKPEIRPRLAFCYMRKGKYEDAVRICLDEISLFPGSLPAHTLLAYVYFQQGKNDEMVAACLDFHSSLEQYCLKEEQKLGKEYKTRRGNQWRLTQENLETMRTKILQRYSNLGLPYFMLGVHYKQNRKFDKALQNIQRAILWEYDPIECHMQLIDIELYQNNWDRALEKSRDALRSLGSHAEFYFLMGYSYYQLGQMDRAESCFSSGFELKPYVVETLKNLAKIHFAMGNFQETTARLRQILRVSPFDYDSKFYLERALSKKRVPSPEQKPKITKNISERPSMKYKYSFESDIAFVTNLINSAAMTLLKKGQLDDAITMTERFLEIYEASPDLNYNLGHYYNMKNDLDNALKYAWNAMELKENFKDAYDLIGNIFFKIGDFESSIKAYSKVIAIDPKDPMSHYNMGCVFSAKGEEQKAEKSWLNALRYEESTRIKNRDEISDGELSFSLVVVGGRVAYKAYTALGHLYKNQRKWDKALEEFKLALELEPNRSDLHYEIGKIYIEMNNIPEAKKSLEKYIYFGGSKEQEVRQLLDSIKTKKYPQNHGA